MPGKKERRRHANPEPLADTAEQAAPPWAAAAFQQLQVTTETLFSGVRSRLEMIERRLDSLAKRMDSLESRVEEIEDTLNESDEETDGRSGDVEEDWRVFLESQRSLEHRPRSLSE